MSGPPRHGSSPAVVLLAAVVALAVGTAAVVVAILELQRVLG
jgi:hypothetical protein